MDELYLVMAVREKIEAKVQPINQSVFVDVCWAEGMIGAMPVFSSREAAEEYADGTPVVRVRVLAKQETK